MSTGCLITDPPQFKPLVHTRPFLVESSADPDPRVVLAVEDSQIADGTQSTLTFAADFVSQDDPVGDGPFDQVQGVLYIDYGFTGIVKHPYLLDFPASNNHRIAPGATIDQTGRRVTADWSPGAAVVSAGCHTVTLVVSHIFDDTPCPVCNDDWSSITWQILRCSKSAGDCESLPLSGPGSCEGLTASCTAVRKATESDPGFQQCPDATDGGAP